MCYFPLSIKPKYKYKLSSDPLAVKVGCGRCQDCRRERSRQWIFRLLHEHKNAVTSYFLTLTYSDENIPYSPNGLPTLNKAEFQKFMKRLRKENSIPNLKYYAVGEYGSKTQRPHFHAIIFNADPKLIEKAWQKGIISLDEVTSSSMAYVTGYVNKMRISKMLRHQDDDRTPEFNLISQGIGKGIITEYQLEKFINTAIKDTIHIAGQKYTIPRYLKDKINISDDVKETIKEEKQKVFEPLNSMDREYLRRKYDERLIKQQKDRLQKLQKAKI